MNTKIIIPNLKEKQISSLRKKVLSRKTSSPEKRIERREKIQILKNFLKSVDKEKYSNKDLVLFLKKNGFKSKESLSFAFKELGYKEPHEHIRLFSFAGYNSLSSLVDCLISSNFRKPKDFSYISKSLDLSYKKQFMVLKKAGFKKIESFAQGVFLKNPTIENYALFFKACNFKAPSDVCRGLMSVGFTSVPELVTGLYAYGFRHKTTFITALNTNGFRGRDIITVLEERNILS